MTHRCHLRPKLLWVDDDRPMTVLSGIGVSPGRVAGPVAVYVDAVEEPSIEGFVEGDDIEPAVDALAAAIKAVSKDLLARADQATGTAQGVLAVTAAMASDPALLEMAAKRIRKRGESPERAIWNAAAKFISRLSDMGGLMAERARDVSDVRDRIVATLTGVRPPGIPEPGHKFVLVAEDLAPSDAAMLDPNQVMAIVIETGGPTSHTSIVARALGIPCVVAVVGASKIPEGTVLLVDGGRGTVEISPSAADVEAANAQSRTVRQLTGPGETADGVRVELLANVGSLNSVKKAVAAQAEGIGLLRTENLFFGKKKEPSIEDQVTAYRAVFDAFAGRKVVVRTLDAGADKPLKFITSSTEPNPALGVRGLRTSREHLNVLDNQIAAISMARSLSSAHVQVMAPMVATADEADFIAALCASHGIEDAGIMIEVPSAALLARWLLENATFASVGTNDLTQYAMAADREVGALAELTTAWQPAVLRLVKAACDGAKAAEAASAKEGVTISRPVGVCGEAAGDPALAPVLVGLGAKSLSMHPASLGDVGAVLAQTTFDQCQQLAAIALESRDAASARDAVRAALPALVELGL